jgi:class 3 adenylate cyclase/DNA polymerase III delta prime subunit
MTSRIETVTVMFTDVAGSTALRERVGEDEAERLRLAHDAIVSGAVDEHDGTVVKHLGDGVMATFASSAQAVSAAVAIQQGLDRINRERRSEPIKVRIGISAGDVTVEDDDYFGIPVVEAQRLEASAEPATIRCAALVRQLSRGRGDHDFAEIGALDLKGLAEPLDAYEVRWTPLADSEALGGDLLPPVLALAGGMPFSGRADALGELTELAKQCSRDGFVLALVAGEPGIGKTRLAHELAVRVAADGWSVMAGRCDEEVVAPYQAFRICLDWCVDHLLHGDATTLGDHPGELVRLLPNLAARVCDLPPPFEADPDAERYRLMQAVESWLATMARRSPLLVVLDDVHWADKASLLLLQHLVRTAPTGVFVVATYRDTDVDRAHPLSSVLADLRRLPGVERIALTGLPLDEVREFLERAGGHNLDETGEAFAELLERETAGNPFFVSEMLRHFAESGLLTRHDGRWTGDLASGASHVPEGIREVVGRRLGRLGADVENVLRAASVIGYEFDIDLLATVTGLPVDDVIDALDLAATANIAVEVGVDRFRFSHALVRETLHDELSSTRRVRQHRKVALAIEELHADDLDAVIAELATHWREASVGGDPTRAAELAIRAGDLAMSSSAPETATSWFSDAAELLEDDPGLGAQRRRALVRLADAQIHSGDTEHRALAVEAAESALADADVEAAVAALTLHWRTSFSEFDEADERKIEMLRDALEHLDLDQVQRADLTGELATELIFTRDIEGRAQALAEFERLLVPLDADVRGTLLNTSFGRITMRFGAMDELLQEAAAWSLGQRSSSTRGAPYSVMWPLTQSDRDGFDRAADAAIAAMDDPFSEAHSVVWRVPIAVAEGDLEDAERLARELLGLMDELAMQERSVYRSTTSFAIERERGHLANQLIYWGSVMDDVHPSSASAAAVAYMRLVTGDPDGAAELLDRFDLSDIADDAGYVMSIAMMTEVIAAIGTDAQARAVLEHLLPGAGTHCLTGGLYLGPLNRLTALTLDRLGDHDAAVEHFGLAVDAATAMRFPTWTARTNLDLAESLIRRGRADEARSALDHAGDALAGHDLPENSSRLTAVRTQLDDRGLAVVETNRETMSTAHSDLRR